MVTNQNQIPIEDRSPITYLRPAKGLAALNLKDLWEYRELIYFLTWRDLKVRYKQTLLGFTWVILQPVINMVVFTILFGQLLKVPTDGIPYPIFSFAALLPWLYFAGSLSRSSTTLVGSANLISKVYFPRMVIPIAGVLSGLVDFLVSLIVLIGMMLFYKIMPTWNLLLLPVFLFLAMLTALGFGLWFSALNVRFRDVNHLVPFIIEIWKYATPVIYGATLIPERFRFLLGLNPMTGVVEGFRWAILGSKYVESFNPGPLFIISISITLVVLISGVIFFRNTERTFADII
jgi:lipopolysaccharide transport system permease protein